ncbi:CpaF family protein [Dermabacteraceae bacterium CCM 9520]
MTSPTTLPNFADLPLNQETDTPSPTPTLDTPRRRLRQSQKPQSPAGKPNSEIDWAAVSKIREKVAQHLAEDSIATLDEEDKRAKAIHLTTGYLRDEDAERIDKGERQWTNSEYRTLTEAVLQALFGFGRLQPLLDDDTIENIEIYGCDDVLIQRTGNVFEEYGPIASSDQELLETLAFYAAQKQRSFNPNHPQLEMSLGTTARLQATGWIVERPIVTIRIHRMIDIDLDDLVETDLLNHELSAFLSAAVKAKKSIMVAGDQGAGKTTLLRALINEISPFEKIATLESVYELHLELLGKARHRRLICLESVPGSDEKDSYGRRIGEITLDDLARSTFRMNLDRLIVGELLGPEVIAMFEAMQTGSGSLSSIHAKSAEAIPERIVTLARKDGRVTEDFARRQVAENIDLAIYVNLDKSPDPVTGRPQMKRRITKVMSYQPGENGQVATTTLFEMRNNELVQLLEPEWASDLKPFLK